MKRALTITGSHKGITGHDNQVRSIVRALHEQDVDIELIDLPKWSAAKLPVQLQDKWFDELTQPVGSSVHLHFCMPHQVKLSSDKRNIVFTMFEADRIPQDWVTKTHSFDLTIVPFEFAKKAWIDSGVPAKLVKKCPLGVDLDRFKPGVQPLKLQTTDGRSAADFAIRFLNISEANPRKNLIGLLRAWLIATSRSDDAALILKPGFYTAKSHERLAKEIATLEQELCKKLDQAGQIFWLTGAVPEVGLPSIFAAATHYISASLGEGFDLPMVEAAASGLQLVAPRHSAYLDYLNDETAYMLPVKPELARFPNDPALDQMFTGAHWWRPDLDAMIGTISDIIAKRAPSKPGTRDAVSHLTWTNTAATLLKIIFEEATSCA